MHVEKYEAEGTATGLREAGTWARRALEVDSRCGKAWAVLSWLEAYSAKPNIERELEDALKAASFSPRDAISHMTVSNAVQSPGSFSLQLAAALRAVDLGPFYLSASGNAVLDLSGLGRPEDALPIADRALRVEPAHPMVLIPMGYVLLKLGRLDEARRTLARWEPQSLEHPNSFVGQMWGQVRFQVAVAERDATTVEKLGRVILPPLLDGRADAMTLANGTWFVSPALALLGRKDEAIRILLRSVEVGVPPPYDLLLAEPGFKPLRGDPRFAKVLTASRDGAARIARILEQARARGELPNYLEPPLHDLVRLLNANGATRK
jgi:tetratricopeptide (TPR) repeat protein